MDEDRRRAALVGCTALALLLTAALMPTAGLGSFPDVGGDSSTGVSSGPSLGPDSVATPTGTVTFSNDSGPATTTTETSTTATTTPEPDKSETSTETVVTTTVRGDQENGSAPADWRGPGLLGILLGSVFGLVGMGLLTVFVGGVLYVGVVLVGGTIFGASAVATLPFADRIQSIPQATMASLIDLSGSTSAILDRLGSITGQGFRLGAGGLGALVTAPVSVFTAFGSGLGGLFGALRGFSLSALGGEEATTPPDEDARDSRKTVVEEEQADEESSPRTIAQAFAWLQSVVPLRNSETATAGEVARSAIDSGLPEAPVRRLTDLFREVRYGGYEETPDRTDSAYDALDRLRGALGGDDD